SGHVIFAAHGHSHRRLDQPTAHLGFEIDSPRWVLASRVNQPVDAFVFPFGRYSRRAAGRARRNYRYLFRIGSAMNRSWSQRMLYRVDADEMTDERELFSSHRLAVYRARHFWN